MGKLVKQDKNQTVVLTSEVGTAIVPFAVVAMVVFSRMKRLIALWVLSESLPKAKASSPFLTKRGART